MATGPTARRRRTVAALTAGWTIAGAITVAFVGGWRYAMPLLPLALAAMSGLIWAARTGRR